MDRQSPQESTARSPDTAAGVGVLAAVMFVIAFIAFATTNPGGDPAYTNVGDAQFVPGYFAENLTAIRLVTLFTALGIALFLWFLATLWTKLREAEEAPGRTSAIVLIGGVAGAVLVLLAQALTATAGLSTSPGQADNVPTLYVASALMMAFGGGVFSVFFFGVAKAIFQTQAMGTWLGWLAVVAGLLSACAFMTPFFSTGVLNAANGGLGRWAWTTGGVVWLLCASITMLIQERHAARAAAVPPPRAPAPGTPSPAPGR